MGIFTSASTEVMRNLEKEVEKKKEELAKEVQLVNENYPIGTLIRFIPKGSSWDVMFSEDK